MGMPESEGRFPPQEVDPDVAAQAKALQRGDKAGQIKIFSEWLERRLEASRARFGDPTTKPPFAQGKK